VTERHQPNARPARIAVVGCGHWATEAHLPALAADSRAELVGVCDPDPEKRAYAAQRFQVGETFEDVSELLARAQPDGVVVAVPHVLHAPLGMAVLAAGAHLLVEKPFVLDPDDGRRMIRAARSSAREILVGYPWHYNVQARDLRTRLAAGAIGEIHAVSCLYASAVLNFYRGDTTADQEAEGYAVAPNPSTYSDPSIAGGGQGQTQLTHAAALLLFITGLRIQRVTAFTQRLGLAVDVVDAVAARFENGALGAFCSTGTMESGATPRLEYRIFGDRGWVVWDVLTDQATIHGSGSNGTQQLPQPPAGNSYPVYAPAANLVEVVLGTAANESPAEPALHTVEFLHAMYRSAEHNGLPFDLRDTEREEKSHER
jgi:predicted dehydrogenase